MIPMRYLGPVHTLGLMWREEGMRGLYRGYSAYLLATAIYIAIIPLFAEFCAMYTPIGGNYEDSSDTMVASYIRKNIRMRVIDNYIFSNQLIILFKLKWLSKTARKKRKNSQINKRTSRLKLTLIV